jgi:hypothetical protein
MLLIIIVLLQLLVVVLLLSLTQHLQMWTVLFCRGVVAVAAEILDLAQAREAVVLVEDTRLLLVKPLHPDRIRL